jgi:hypothetical protein
MTHPRDPHAPASDPDIWAPRLGRLLDRQRDLYEHLAGLAEEQSACIESDRTDGLLDVLARRQVVIEEISRINEDVAPFVRTWATLVVSLPERHRSALRTRFDAVARLVDRIAARDEADRAALERRRESVGLDIQSISRSRGAVTAYSRLPQSDPVFQDRHG